MSRRDDTGSVECIRSSRSTRQRLPGGVRGRRPGRRNDGKHHERSCGFRAAGTANPHAGGSCELPLLVNGVDWSAKAGSRRGISGCVLEELRGRRRGWSWGGVDDQRVPAGGRGGSRVGEGGGGCEGLERHVVWSPAPRFAMRGLAKRCLRFCLPATLSPVRERARRSGRRDWRADGFRTGPAGECGGCWWADGRETGLTQRGWSKMT